MTKKITQGLGKGLGALLPSIEFSKEKGFNITPQEEEGHQGGSFAVVDISRIHQNPYQPRQDFDEIALDDLRKSIEEHGIIQPITVRRDINGYELIAGERRLRASIAAGLEEMPVFILDVNDSDTLIIALIENVQREDLNPVEIAYGYKQLIEEYSLSQEEVAAKVGKKRSTVANFLRLLRLPDKVHESLRNRDLSMGHARALLGISDERQILQLWAEVLDKGMSVRETETIVKEIESKGLTASDKKKDKRRKEIISKETKLNLEHSEDKLRQLYGTEVRIKAKTEESGSIEFDFFSKDDFGRLLDLFSKIND